MRKFRNIIATTLLCAACSSAMAADSPLPAGKPAGTKQAALEGDGLRVLIGLAAIAAVTYFAASQGGGKSTGSTSSTSGTSS